MQLAPAQFVSLVGLVQAVGATSPLLELELELLLKLDNELARDELKPDGTEDCTELICDELRLD